MPIRFRLSDQAFLQQQTLQVPMCLLEHLVQPAWRASSLLLSARVLQQLPAELRLIARRFIGLYVVADGQGQVVQIAKMTHRLGVLEQESNYACISQSQTVVAGGDESEVMSFSAAS